MNTHCLEYGTHRTTGLNTGTGSCGFHEYAGTAEFGCLLVRNSLLAQRDPDKILLCILDAFGDGCGNLIGFSKAITYDTVLIAYYDDCSEAEVTATLGNLGHSLYRYQSVLKFQVDCLYFLGIDICHSA